MSLILIIMITSSLTLKSICVNISKWEFQIHYHIKLELLTLRLLETTVVTFVSPYKHEMRWQFLIAYKLQGLSSSYYYI